MAQGFLFIITMLVSTFFTLLTSFTMFALFKGLHAVGILRVSREEEEMGLDLSEHGMRAYGDNLS